MDNLLHAFFHLINTQFDQGYKLSVIYLFCSNISLWFIKRKDGQAYVFLIA